MNQDNPDEPKLIIDEDWKTQVQREKEQLKNSPEAGHGQEGPAAAEDKPTTTPLSDEDFPPPPPASLSLLATSLATQAMAAMGQLPNEEGTTLPINLDYAKHFIDLLGVLEDKTKGNLTPEESGLMQDILHQMRMLFVAVSKQAKGGKIQ